jgi:peptide/nickel transport system permease protein
MKRFFARASRHVGFQIGAVLLLLFVGTALVSIFWTPHPVDDLQMRAKLMPSSALYPLGTDHLGRDVLSRIMVGAQTSISVGLIAVVIGMSAGVTLGAWAAARGGWVDEALSRTSDLIFAFPAVLIAILITSVLGASAQNAILAIAIFNIPVFARVTRGAALSMWSRDFVRAATAMGHHRASRAAQHRQCPHRTGNHPVRRRHPGRGRTVLSRTGRPAAGAVVGPHAARRPDLHLSGTGTCGLAGPCHCTCRAGP